MKITFYGVRGSFSSPALYTTIQRKYARMLTSPKMRSLPQNLSENEALAWMEQNFAFEERGTYGGNTTCVEVRVGEIPIILDMGNGLRELGNRQMPELIANKGLNGIILQSHLHWDHIQGLPAWKPLYMPRRMFNSTFSFYGGKDWSAKLEDVLQGQMDGSTVFPVSLQELRQTAMHMDFHSVWDGWSMSRDTSEGRVDVLTRKLNHPQETYGYRIKTPNGSIAFTTDHEPYAVGIPRPLIELVSGVDVWITDCQYTRRQYEGLADGTQRLGWGHSFPEYIAQVAKTAEPGRVITTHHDPDADDDLIAEIAKSVAEMSSIPCGAAYEGLVIDV